MPLFPIVERELRVGSRQKRTYFTRFGAGMLAMGLAMWIVLVARNEMPPALGGVLFKALAVMSFIYAVVTGARMTSDALSEEKREGTLGLLFLTDLRSYDVVFGKLIATSFNSFYGALAIFPILAVPLPMGGVTGGELWRVSLAVLALLFLSCSVGLLGSALCRDDRRSIATGFLLLLTTIALGPAIGLAVMPWPNGPYDTSFFMSSPITTCVTAFDKVYALKPNFFWTSLTFTVSYSLIALWICCMVVPRSWQDKPTSRKKEALTKSVNELISGAPAKAKAFRQRLLDQNAFYWLAARNRGREYAVWIFIVVVALFWLWGYLEYPNDWLNPGTFLVTALILHTSIKLWVASEACRRFVDDRRSGALELILSTSMSVPEILSGQLKALMRQFNGPVVLILAMDCLFALYGLRDPGNQGNEQIYWVLVWVAGMIVFIADLVALSWVSMWLGMQHTHANKAAGAAIGRVLVFPWVIFFIAVTVLNLATLIQTSSSIDEKFWTGFWFVLSVGLDAYLILSCRNQLLTRFRDSATQRGPATGGFWSSLLSGLLWRKQKS